MFLLKPKIRILSAQKCYSLINSAGYNTSRSSDDVPIIRIPKYIENNRGQTIYKEHKKNERSRAMQPSGKLDPKLTNKLIISSNTNRSMNHYYGNRYHVNNVPLISQQWLKIKSVGEEMTFHRFDSNPSLLANKKATFKELGLNSILENSISKIVTQQPSLIQVGVIPRILQNKNVVFSAETGSGKTIAYLAPIIQMIHKHKIEINKPQTRHKNPYGLVILPSRELTEQVGNVAKQITSCWNDPNNVDVGVSTIIGGAPRDLEQSGRDLIVTTIGMVENHLEKGYYNLSQLNHLVLDEADTLLDEKFSPETMDLVNNIRFLRNDNPNGAQLICCSATIPTTLSSTIGTKFDLDDDIDQVTTQNLHHLHPNVKHVFKRLKKRERDVQLMELLITNRGEPTIIFVNRTNAVNWLHKYLLENDFECVRLTAQMDDAERADSFRRFQEGEVDILVTTDLGSRGLDTNRVTHVINFDSPHYVSDYIHRAGRTGRLGSKGGSCKVTSLVAYKPDVYMLIELEKAVRLGKPTFSQPNFARTSDNSFNSSNKHRKQ